MTERPKLNAAGRVMHRLQWGLALGVVVVFGMMFYMAATEWGDFLMSWALDALGLAGLLAILVWSVRYGKWFAVAGKRQMSGRTFGIRLAALPVLFVLLIVLQNFGIPRRVAWAMSRPAMDRWAAAAMATAPAQPPYLAVEIACPSHLGWYRCYLAERTASGVRFIYGNDGWMSGYGYAYLPRGPPTHHYVHVDGPWYGYIQRDDHEEDVDR